MNPKKIFDVKSPSEADVWTKVVDWDAKLNATSIDGYITIINSNIKTKYLQLRLHPDIIVGISKNNICMMVPKRFVNCDVTIIVEYDLRTENS